MLFLTSINVTDLFTICFIVIACLITMIGIIMISSNTNPENKRKIPELEKEIVQEEKEDPLENIIEETPKQDFEFEIKKKQTPIEDVLAKMEDEIVNGPSLSHTFEEEQEENAIISYTELLKVAGKLKEENDRKTDILEKGDMPRVTKVDVINDAEVEERKASKFKKTDFISPIYGMDKNNIEETNKPIEKQDNNEFLSTLRDLRSNLE